MAKKQTRRSISVSRLAYERLKSFCETSGISMSQFVESGINEKLDESGVSPTTSSNSTISTQMVSVPAPRQAPPQRVNLSAPSPYARQASPAASPTRPMPTPMTSAAARFAVDPPPPIIKRSPVDQQPKPPTEPTPGQIFTF